MQHETAESATPPPLPPPTVRRMGPQDEAALLAALAGDRGHALFIASNLLSYGLDGDDPRYWAQLWPAVPATMPEQRDTPVVEAILMRAGGNGNLYALPGVDPQPLITVALAERFAFIMGEATVMAQIEARAVGRLRLVERHHFADLPQPRFHTAPFALPAGATVRRGHPRDVDALARLYFRSSGFEGLSYPQVRNVMMSRLTLLRTHLAEMDGEVVAAAATTAESYEGAMIGGVWTAPHARGRGLSTAVMASLARELLRERRRPHLFYLEDNVPAARVYAKIGFRVTGSWRVLYFAS